MATDDQNQVKKKWKYYTIQSFGIGFWVYSNVFWKHFLSCDFNGFSKIIEKTKLIFSTNIFLVEDSNISE